MLGQIVGLLVIIMVAFALFPLITNQVNQAVAINNSSSNNLLLQTSPFSTTILQMLPLFFGLIIICTAILIVFRALRSTGLDEVDDKDNYETYKEQEEEREQRIKKQTYLGYIKERMAAERLLSGGIFTDWIYRIIIGLFFIIIILLIIYLRK